jgi:hypothetical protein
MTMPPTGPTNETVSRIYPTEITCNCPANMADAQDVTANDDGSHTFTGPTAHENYEAHLTEAEQAPS